MDIVTVKNLNTAFVKAAEQWEVRPVERMYPAVRVQEVDPLVFVDVGGGGYMGEWEPVKDLAFSVTWNTVLSQVKDGWTAVPAGACLRTGAVDWEVLTYRAPDSLALWFAAPFIDLRSRMTPMGRKRSFTYQATYRPMKPYLRLPANLRDSKYTGPLEPILEKAAIQPAWVLPSTAVTLYKLQREAVNPEMHF